MYFSFIFFVFILYISTRIRNKALFKTKHIYMYVYFFRQQMLKCRLSYYVEVKILYELNNK